ncbi:hypothetical protein [Alysiella filiformis]|uniref:HTH HARE-type domain-containing protein n=1 Tax=Alysiella filiformis DSM 16848 TaxID=1120981 RepID=A0A286EH60_9NEIS|nr:hypothetical protein [Alysiella filiformis]QMT32319.1 hypothetical protein H3L97_05685 [Alysiella filiformis]UBQ56761.1 hypothetical protein JF568_03005 [Alysiella filiformis DSM 16848]SOD70255.1 hypothetical protein SAMN02746062_02043 [Alysiella filiformis DSM 16848]
MQNNEKLTFTELAILAMEMVNRPITPSELWEFVLQNQLHHRLKTFDEATQNFIGKTPKDSFQSNIYTNTEYFELIPNTKPKQYILKQTLFRQPEIPKSSKKAAFHERDLHTVLSYFLHKSAYFQAYAKTIFHEESTKTQKGADKWLYPDMVAAHFEYASYQKGNVLNFIKKFDILPIKLFSFELKKELDYGNFKEAFFQAVSNSSWANEGYLVACDIKQDNQFIESLQKLSQSFGIGIIHLNLNDITQSKIVSPAQFKDKMDYSVVHELANKNPNFAQFLKTITDFEPQNPSRFTAEFDKILSENELQDYLQKHGMI